MLDITAVRMMNRHSLVCINTLICHRVTSIAIAFIPFGIRSQFLRIYNNDLHVVCIHSTILNYTVKLWASHATQFQLFMLPMPILNNVYTKHKHTNIHARIGFNRQIGRQSNGTRSLPHSHSFNCAILCDSYWIFWWI